MRVKNKKKIGKFTIFTKESNYQINSTLLPIVFKY